VTVTAFFIDNYGDFSYSWHSYSDQENFLTDSQFSLTPAMFQVLLALGDEEKHGYAILKDVEDQTDGHVHLSTGTLYAMIKRLLAEGILKECRNRPPADEDDQRRRYYRLTALGRELAVAEAERLEKLIATAREKHLLRRLRPA
jgi:DNA-binding PadR family transcriptional regulator